jgi:hypothetical protein
MFHQALSSVEGVIKENVRSSQLSVPQLVRHTRYSRHPSFQHERISTNRRSQIVIHTTIRSPKNSRRVKDNKSTKPDVDLHSVSYLFHNFIYFYV